MSTESKTDIIRRRILDETRHLLVEKGINGLSTRMIAKKVGCSVGSIYFHFENKDKLIHSLIEEGFEKLVAIQEAAVELLKSPLEKLKALCRNYLSFAIENPEYYEIMFMLKPEQMARYPAEKYRKARRSVSIVADALNECAEQNLLTVENAYMSAHLVWSYMHGVISLIHVKRIDRRINQERMIDTAIQQIARMHPQPL